MFSLQPDRINNFLIQKHHLTDETRSCDIIKVVKDIGGLHATAPTTPYLSLLARMRKFEKRDLDRELYERRTLAKVRYVRTTVYILPRNYIPTAFAAIRRMSEPKSEAYSKFLGISEKEYKETSKRIIEALKRQGGMTAKSIRRELGSEPSVSSIVNLMCDQGILIRGAPEKSWRSNLHTYHFLSEVFPDIKLDGISEKDARKEVVAEYLSAFGPVTEEDISWWSGFSKTQVRQIIGYLKDKIACVEESTLNKTYFMLSSEIGSLASLKTPEKHVINLLPSLDPYLMGYKNRDRYVDPKNYDYVFDRSGNAASSVLLNGQVIGVWDFDEPFVKFFLFDNVGKKVLWDIGSKAISVGIFMSGKETKVKKCDTMTPLTKRTAGGVMSPLKDA